MNIRTISIYRNPKRTVVGQTESMFEWKEWSPFLDCKWTKESIETKETMERLDEYSIVYVRIK